jgi:hypothetical protein
MGTPYPRQKQANNGKEPIMKANPPGVLMIINLKMGINMASYIVAII